jgi:conjugal transfer mating pair stabilization protein TraG
VTYALFPLLVLLLLLTSGRETMLAFKGYAAILIWIQLWPPLYAVLNYMASIYASYDLAAAADLGAGVKALSLQTASTIYSRAISGEAVVGYLAISIPFIAWAALKRMENFGTALVGGLSGLQGVLSGSTGAAATGNVNMGNVAMDQTQLAPNRTSAFMGSLQNDLTGNTFSSNALTGLTAVSLLRNQGFASRVVSMRVSEQDVTQASQQADAARADAVSANTERAAALTQTFSRGLAKLRSSRSSSGTASSSFEQMGETLNRLDQISKSVAGSTGLTQSQVAQIAFGASGHLGVNTAVAGAEIQARGGKNYSSGISAAQQKVLNSLTQEQIAEFKQFGDRVSRDSSVVDSFASDAREGQEMSSRLSSATSRAKRADAAYSERTAFAERLSSARDRGESISVDIAQDPHNLEMFLRYAEQYGGNSAAALSMFDAELARQGLRPNRSFSDGTALPNSFGDVHALHDRQASDPGLSPDLAATNQRQRAKVSRSNQPVQRAISGTDPSPLRGEIQMRGEALRNEAGAAGSRFDQKAQIVDTGDGTLATKNSLLKQSGKQVVDDAEASINDARDAVKDLLRKKK